MKVWSELPQNTVIDFSNKLIIINKITLLDPYLMNFLIKKEKENYEYKF